MDYVNLVRVQYACEQMKHGNDSMDEVARKAGFSTTSTFNRNFKKFFNTSPYQWKINPQRYERKLQNFHINALKDGKRFRRKGEKMSRFIKGMDLSTLLELERCGAKYYDHGKERDILDIMRDYDVDTIRLRLWNDPYSETGEPYGAGCNDLAETIAIGKKYPMRDSAYY